MPTYQYWDLASVLVLGSQVNVTRLQTDTLISWWQVARIRTADLLLGRLVLSHLQLKIHFLLLENHPTLLQVSESLSLRKVTAIACQQWPDLRSQSHIFIIKPIWREEKRVNYRAAAVVSKPRLDKEQRVEAVSIPHHWLTECFHLWGGSFCTLKSNRLKRAKKWDKPLIFEGQNGAWSKDWLNLQTSL